MRRLMRVRDRNQLSFALETNPRNGEELLALLYSLGLPRKFTTLRLTRNRTVMVSFNGSQMRVHEAYLASPRFVHVAIVTFAAGRTRAERRAAREIILSQPFDRNTRLRRQAASRPDDLWMVAELERWHRRYNARHFGGTLKPVSIRVSRRMKSRLGHYTVAIPRSSRAEIAIGYRHIEKHGWEEALHTLLHEMVHQWQDENGYPIDHGARFRQKARDVGVTASAFRTVRPHRQRGSLETLPYSLGIRAARDSG